MLFLSLAHFCRRVVSSVPSSTVLLLCLNTLAGAQTLAAPPSRPTAPTAAQRLRGVTLAQVKAKIEADKKALADDPVAAVHRLLALPPVTQVAAAFQGNQTALVATPNNAFAMMRNTDCSLTAFNAAYTLMTTASTATYSSQSMTMNFEQAIHTAAGLTTTVDQFQSGCAESSIGIASNDLIIIGETTTGARAVAYAGYQSQVGHNVTYVLSMTSAGALIGTTVLPDPSVSGTYPVSLLALDLNKDGNNDLISINSGGGTQGVSVTISLGNPDGTFQPGVSYAVPGSVATGGVIDDFDEDGNLDIAVPTSTNPAGTIAMAVLPGKGDGTFGTAKTTSLTGSGAIQNGVISGDFNGDGKKDLISGYGLVLLGKGDGTFTQSATRAFPALSTTFSDAPKMARGDFNKDGKLDLAAGTGAAIYVFLGNGDGTFSPGSSYATTGNRGHIAATDLDGDGNLDIYSGTASNGAFGGDDFVSDMGYALMGNGDGTFRGATQIAPTTTGVANTSAVGMLQGIEDLNGDGKLDYVALVEDLLTADGKTGAASFQTFFGRGDGNFTAGPSVAVLPITYGGTTLSYGSIDSYTLIDVNGDGQPDLVILPAEGPGLGQGFEVALGKADGSFQAPTYTLFPSLVASAADTIFQVTGMSSSKRSDGKSEIIYNYAAQSHTSPFPYTVGIATQVINGDGTFAAPVLTVTQTTTADAGAGQATVPLNVVDVNGDEDPDLIFYVPSVYSYPPGGNPVLVSGATFSLALGKADGTFATPQPLKIVDGSLGLLPVTVADVNGDGKTDLIALGTSTTTFGAVIGVALGNGDGTFQTPKVIALDAGGGGFESLAAADFDGDGKVDIAMLGFEPPNDSGVFLGNGDGTFQSSPGPDNNGKVIPLQPLYLGTYGATAIVADLNGDGKPDIGGSIFLLNQYNMVAAVVATSTALTASPTSITTGQTVTLTAAVTAATGTAIPGGTITFLDGTTSLGTATINGQGVATLAVTTLAAGSHGITAAYPAGSSFGGSLSSPLTITVSAPKINSTIALTASTTTITTGQSVTFTATAAQASGTVVPTGTITFVNGTNTLGAGMLNAQGVATFSTVRLPVGMDLITATYAGDASFNSSASPPVTVTVSAVVVKVSTTTTITASSSQITTGSSVTLTATVKAASGVALPTGIITFLNNTTTSLGTGTLNGQGVATLNTAALPLGTAAITASYPGDTNFAGSVSNPVGIAVTAPVTADYSVSLGSAIGTVSNGSSAQTTITLTPSGSFTGIIALACSNLPQHATCSFNPASVTLGTAATTSTLTVQTGVALSAGVRDPRKISGQGRALLRAISLCGIFAFFAGMRGRRTLLYRLPMFAVSLIALVELAGGCGHSSNATPPGTYTVTVTATSGSITHSAPFGLTVQ